MSKASTAMLVTDDELGGGTTPTLSTVELVAEPKATWGVAPSSTQTPSPMLNFPASSDRPQDIVLRMMLKGESPDKIAEILGPQWTAEKVSSLAEQEWITQRLNEIANEGVQSTQQVQNLLVSHSFRAVVRLGDLIQSKNEKIALGAAKTVLSLAMPTTAEREKGLGADAPLTQLTDAQVRQRALDLDRRIEQLKTNLKPIKTA